MKLGSFILTTLMLLTSCASSPQKAVADPSANGSPTPAGSIEESQKSEFPMSASEKKKMAADFKKALSNEEKALANKEKSELKSLNRDQNSRKKAWYEQEKRARHKFFDQHMSGPERREYVQDYLKRKKEFDQNIQNEMSAAKQSWKDKREALKQSQKDREAQFKASIDQGKRPNASLWPK